MAQASTASPARSPSARRLPPMVPPCWRLQVDGALMGLATVHPTFEPGVAWLATLHVSRAHRRRGAASGLWDASVALARAGVARSAFTSGAGAGLQIPCTQSCSPTSLTTSHLVCTLDG